MDDDEATTETTSSGGELRRQLENFQGQARESTEILTGILLRDNPLVKPEDVAKIPAKELESKVKELQEARVAEREAAARDYLRERTGLEGEALDEALKGFNKTPDTTPPAQQFGSMKQYAEIDGTPPGQIEDDLSSIADPSKRAAMAAMRERKQS